MYNKFLDVPLLDIIKQNKLNSYSNGVNTETHIDLNIDQTELLIKQ